MMPLILEIGPMPELSPLEREVESLFQESLQSTANQPSLESFHLLLQQCHERLHQPMRVAIVGLIKAGKSTLINALMGKAIVATGRAEATFNINWLKYDRKPSLKVHFKENRAPEAKSFEELAALTLRPKEHQAYLLSIKYIEVFYPNDILKVFNIIDTPGLKSFYEDDSANTRDFLQLHGQELTEITQREAGNADAVLYLFSRPPSAVDQEVVEQFQGAVLGNTTPLNAIGVLTKVDNYWSDPKIFDPISVGSKLAQRWAEHPKIRRRLYAIYPICGLLAQGAQTLTEKQFDILIELAKLPEERFEYLLRNVKRFGRDYDDVLVPGTHRKQLVEQLGQYGVWLAYRFISSGGVKRELLVLELLKHSGLDKLRHLILSHFGHRAFLIKLDTILRQISVAYFQQRHQLQEQPLAVLEDVTGKFDALRAREHTFRELEVLQDYYKQKLDFDDIEQKQLLEVTGEYGNSLGERLGLNVRATVPEMLHEANERVRYWKQRANDRMGTDRATLAAARVLARCYENILYKLQKADEYLA